MPILLETVRESLQRLENSRDEELSKLINRRAELVSASNDIQARVLLLDGQITALQNAVSAVRTKRAAILAAVRDLE